MGSRYSLCNGGFSEQVEASPLGLQSQVSMKSDNLNEAEQDPGESRWMALDVGAKRIGVAITDPLRLTSRPLTTVSRRSDGIEFRRLAELVEEWSVEKLVVGYPRRLTGESSDSTRLVDSFLVRLRESVQVPIEPAEERLSSKEAERRMAEIGIPIERRRAERDAFAAALILEWYLGECSGLQG